MDETVETFHAKFTDDILRIRASQTFCGKISGIITLTHNTNVV